MQTRVMYGMAILRPEMIVEILPPPPPSIAEVVYWTTARLLRYGAFGALLVVAFTINPAAFIVGGIIGFGVTALSLMLR